MTEQKKPDTAAPADDPALQRAAAIVAAVAADPIAVSNQLLQWQNAVKGVHALLHAIVKMKIGINVELIVPRAEHQAPDVAHEELLVTTLENGDVHVVLRSKSRAERRAEAKRPHA